VRAGTLIAFVVTLALTPLVIAGLRRLQVLDVPSARSSHTTAIPRGGGLAVAAGALVGLLAPRALGNVDSQSLTTLLVVVSIMAVAGLVDDLRSLSVWPRLGAQLVGAVLCLPYLLANTTGPLSWRLAAAVLAVVWMMGFVNAFNFMDGINGISAVTALLAGATYVVIGQSVDSRLITAAGAVVAGAALGFLPWNFPHARVFLGDVGSYFLGAWLAFLALIAALTDVPPEAALAPFAVYLADTGITLARRVLRGERWYEAHRQHVYQRLNDHGWSHARVTLLVGAWTLACSALGLVSLSGTIGARLMAGAALVAVLGAYLALPRVVGAIPVEGRTDRRPAGA